MRLASAAARSTGGWKSMGSSPEINDSSNQNLRKPRSPFERRVARFVALLAAPGLLVSGILLWLLPWTLFLRLALLGVELFACLLIVIALRDQIVRPLQTLANVVGALREGDYSLRARVAVSGDALGELSQEVNALADWLAENRIGTVEAAALLQRVVEEVDIPIFAFDLGGKLRLVNSAGEKLMQRSAGQLLGRMPSEIGLQSALSCENETLVALAFGGEARWFVRRSSFRQQGVPHTLVVLSDVSRPLREEERRAWQRLIRVLGHELNNSLAPIKSIAGSLNARLSTTNLDPDQLRDFQRGLTIIESRAASLNRFLQAYRQLAQMPAPVLRQCDLSTVVNGVADLETRVHVAIVPGPDVTLMADSDQLEQMLINLLRNAVEAVLDTSSLQSNMNGSKEIGARESGPPVAVTWKLTDKDVILTIEDSGSGLMNPSNAFVPFYTTKPEGSGIGLVLSRQICEAHGGSLELTNRIGQRGCAVKVILPLTT